VSGLVDLVESELTALRAVAAGAFAFVGVAAGGLDVIASTAGTWFPMIAVTATAILPEFGYAEFGQRVLLLAAFVYVGILAARLGETAKERFQS
jgi:hypothetical protein